jgi:TRAP-type C4-dicarboxylate transport system permease small subunit
MTTPASLDEMPKVLNAEGEFQVEDEAIDLSVYAIEDWLGFVVFCALGATVFHQFFTRYALNDSAAWTEEIARYLLVCTVFIGIVGSVRKNSHIHVDFFYHWLPRWITRPLSTLVDLVRIVFFGYAAWLTWLLIGRIGGQPMSVAPIAIGWVYGVVMLSFAAMTLRAIQVTARNWRNGYSVLERPETMGASS